MSRLELETVRKLVPKNHRSIITQDFLDRVEGAVTDPAMAEQFKENFISYLDVLKTGKYKMEDYISAVKYVSFKLLGYTNKDAYAATFPERYARLKKSGQAIDAFVGAYNKGKLVNQIYEQTLVPTWVLNAPLHQEALTELARMIRDPSVRGMSKVKACEAILNYTKPPEVQKAELKIGVDQQDTISELREVTEQLASALQQSVKNGESLVKITNQKIIDVKTEPIEIEGD